VCQCFSPLSGSTSKAANFPRLSCGPPWTLVGDVRAETVHINGKAVRQAVCMGQTTATLPALIEPQLTGISPLALGLEGYEEAQTRRGDRVLKSGLVVQDAVKSRNQKQKNPATRAGSVDE
jgi:hypothetical protein